MHALPVKYSRVSFQFVFDIDVNQESVERGGERYPRKLHAISEMRYAKSFYYIAASFPLTLSLSYSRLSGETGEGVSFEATIELSSLDRG